ncbi:ABC transporter substrate-binding protein [Alicyclobacillus sp. SO9]|uniref:ABC transporter substrate-binding protein n=1 Tax=Alicyclobacillus sp. SO9 TaxID=2665646 RepID=UPI0018E7BAB4|nr:ABC transporter substrate-binding protein [Alicyclobacillus sp. SO9]QQE77936.1 carbohydrate ABC transporter substrate-binding protein [Alicyclobacillus sp. SO9]
MKGITKKTGISVLSVATMGALLAGCGTANNSATGNTGNSAGGSGKSGSVEIFSWWTGVASSKALKQFFNIYEQKYPGVKVINAAVSGGAGSNAKAVLASRMEAGKPPATFQVHAGRGSLKSWVEAGDMTPLNSLYKQMGWDKVFPKSLLNLVTFNGKIYAVPVDMQRDNVLWYNTKIFKKYNLTPPSTFSEFFKDAKVLKSHGITPLALANHGNWETTILWSDVLLGTVGYTKYNELMTGKLAWNSPGVTKASQTFLKMLQYTNSDYNSLHWAQADGLVAKGKAAMNVQGDWAQGYFTTTAHLKPNVDFGWAPTPGTKGIFAAVSDVFGLPSKLKGQTKTNATNFLKVLGSAKGQKEFNTLKGTISPRLDAKPSDYNAYGQSAMKSYQHDKLVLTPGQGAVNPGFTTALENAMTQLISSKNVKGFESSLQSAAQQNPLK